MHIRCPHCHNAIEIVEDSSFRDVACPSCGSHFNLVGGDAPTQSGPAKPRQLGHFELIEQLGVGHFGTVWKAKDTQLDRFVAVKIPRREQLDEVDIEKFFREARAAAQLRHPNVVAVHEVGRDGNTIFIASDYVAGATLREWLGGQPLPPRDAAKLCATIADALHAAHEAGVIHRDLKPGNIMMGMDDEPHIMDFGLAKRESGEITMTLEGALVGTPAYMPPEQAAGKGHEADRRSDVYALGVILFEMLTGELPFRGEKRMLVVQIQRDEPPSPRKLNGNVPRDLETICLKCLEKSPEKRYQSAAELSAEFKRFLEGKPIRARAIGSVARAWRWAKRNPAAAVLISLVVVNALGGPAIAVRQSMLRRDLEETLSAKTNAQVDLLLNADIQAVPSILQELTTDSDSMSRRLRALQVNRHLTDHQRLRLHLALVRSDDSIATELVDQLLTTHLLNVPVIATALQPHAAKISETLWQVLRDKSQPDERRFRAGLSLASLGADSSPWSEEDNAFLVHQLVAANPEHQPSLRPMLLKRKTTVYGQFERVFADARADDNLRLAAARALAYFVGNDGPRLARLASLATPGQYQILFPQLAQWYDRAAKDTLGELVAEQPTNELTELQRGTWGQQRAGAAISLLRLGDVERSRLAFQIEDDPESLTQFVHRCRDRGVRAQELVNSLHKATAVHNRFALLLALGDYPFADVDVAQRDSLIKELSEAYRSDPSSAIHGATGWLLRKWGFAEEVTQVDRTPLPYDVTGKRQWYVLEIASQSTGVTGMSSGIQVGGTAADEKIYFTFVVFPPGQYQMGSPEDEVHHQTYERLHRVRLTRPLAVSAYETTWAQYDPVDGGVAHRELERQYSRKLTPGEPGFGMNWFEAVAYCRWLTTQAGHAESDQCYDDPKSLPADEAGNPKQWPVHLERHGFRLLTEAEWEYACRSGVRTAYGFGSDRNLLAHYAWFNDNSERWSHPVGLLRPNLSGLFDVQGNMYEWCHDGYQSDLADNAEDPIGAEGGSLRLGRGGSWTSPMADCRAGNRGWSEPAVRVIDMGFRIGTVPSASPADSANGAESDSQ